jgi:nucleoside-diphosphate-sugar epimerase
METSGIALVTGATGFVGGQLIRRLLRENFKVRALTSGTSRESLVDVDVLVEWFPLTEAGITVATQGVTHFFNFAVVYDRPNYNEATIHEVNVALPLRIIAALEAGGRDVNCILGDTFYRKFPPTATAQFRYTLSKDLLARRIAALPANHPCRFAMLVIEQVYGPGENLEKAYPRVTRQLLQHVPRVSLTQGDQRRDFIHIKDVVEAAIVVGPTKWEGVAVVGCGSGSSTPVRHIFERLKALSQSRSELGFGDMPADQSIADSMADTSWLRNQGWTCNVSLEEGLQDFLIDVQRRSSGAGSPW